MDTDSTSLSICDVIFVIEGSAGMTCYLKELKDAYILPILWLLFHLIFQL